MIKLKICYLFKILIFDLIAGHDYYVKIIKSS